MKKPENRLARFALNTVIYIAVFWCVGFLLFFLQLPRSQTLPEDFNAEGIIVLTGGAGRVEAGMELLERKAGKRLLISGVHPSVTPLDMKNRTEASAELMACCVDLDPNAHDTLTNATESSKWVHKQGFKRIILVTSAYHMPRAYILFTAALPEADVLPYPVGVGLPVHLAAREYNKYIYTFVQNMLSMFQ